MYKLKTDTFRLELSPVVFDTEVQYPVNAALSVKVFSDDFSATASMDIDIKEFAVFAKGLLKLYELLSGSARIEEPYGLHNYIEFEAVQGGHIHVKGVLTKETRSGYTQKLSFENEFDQTYFQYFAKELFAAWGNYLE